jgi:hypothetical protein
MKAFVLAIMTLANVGCVSVMPSFRTEVRNGKEFYVLDFSSPARAVMPELIVADVVTATAGNKECVVKQHKKTDHGFMTFEETYYSCSFK